MALDRKAEAALALHRFGLGPRLGSITAIAADPRGALLSELDRAEAASIADHDLLTSGAAAREAFRYQQAQRAVRQAKRAPASDRREGMSGAAPGNASSADAPNFPRTVPGRTVPQQIYLEEVKARLHVAFHAETGFMQRMVWFWSNHFCVSADKEGVRAICGAYEREAIRAHVLGRFSDMLLAVESHPAMLIYLDNARSLGPDSLAGIRRRRGLNENLAREILELHTLGVRSTYTQEDVSRFANVITGWTVIPPRQDPIRGGEFTFNARMHQPGVQMVLGTSYPDRGMEQGRDVLCALARHPATATHVAGKLARHFISDAPPSALVERLSRCFIETEGDLKELAKSLVTAPESWNTPRNKLKRPGEWIIGALRAANVMPPDTGPIMQAQNLLGEPLWRPPAPKGFPDESAPWLDGLAQRLDIAHSFARRIAEQVDPREVFAEVLAPLASSETRQTVLRAESRSQALTLLFMAPEFQRR